MAAELELDWIKVPVAWDAYQPSAAAPPRLQTLDGLMDFAAETPYRGATERHQRS